MPDEACGLRRRCAPGVDIDSSGLVRTPFHRTKYPLTTTRNGSQIGPILVASPIWNCPGNIAAVRRLDIRVQEWRMAFVTWQFLAFC